MKLILHAGIMVLLYGSMMLVGIFPLQIAVSAIYGVSYELPTYDQLVLWSSAYVSAVALQYILKGIVQLLKALLGDLWINIQNELSRVGHTLLRDKSQVKRTTAGRMQGWINLLLPLASIGYFVYSFIHFESAQVYAIYLWGLIVDASVKFALSEPKSEEE